MKTKGKVLSLFVVFCLVLGIMPVSAAKRTGNTVVYSSDTTIDVSSITSDTVWTINEGVTVTVNGRITVTNSASLTLNGSGKILKAANFSDSYAFYVNQGSTVTIDGVTIDGNKENQQTFEETKNMFRVDGKLELKSGDILNHISYRGYGAVIYISSNPVGQFEMSGGIIHDNEVNATRRQGGAAIYNMGECSISGGDIFSNRSTGGGAIYNGSLGKMNITGGSIYNNTATMKDDNQQLMGHGTLHSALDSADSVLCIGGNADIQDNIYLDNGYADKLVYLTSQLSNPLEIVCRVPEESRAIAEGKNYTVTAKDMARISIENSGWYFGLNQTNNRIFITQRNTEAYIPIQIETTDNGSSKVELKQNGVTVAELVYNGSGAYTGNLKEGTYDVFVNTVDTGRQITVDKNGTNTFPADTLVIAVRYTVTLPSGDGFAVTGSTMAIEGADREYVFALNHGYHKADGRFSVKVNGRMRY